jgi:predicted phage terminase large subunit-like protein
MVFMPPRHGKSLLTSEIFPAWWLGQYPEKYVIAASYAQELADDFGRKVRNNCKSPQHEALFPEFSLRDDSQAVSRFHTSQNGVYYAVGAGGAVTGRGAHLLLIDDPTKGREDAESEASRRHLKDWYTSVARTRLMPNGSIVIILTRWHQDDLAGWLLREHAHEGWEVVNLPAISEGEGDALGRPEGEALWTEAYPLSELETIKRSIGSRDWAALYQQRPAPQQGGLVKTAWFRRYDAPPAHPRRIIQSWDTGLKAAEVNDPSVCTTWAETDTGVYLLDVFVKRLEYPDLRRMAESLAIKWFPTIILIEDKASGQSIVQDLVASTRLPVLPIEPKGDKVVRLMAVSAQIESGRVYLPNAAPWLADYEAEMSSFPNAVHDDQVDSTSQALSYFTKHTPMRISSQWLSAVGA